MSKAATTKKTRPPKPARDRIQIAKPVRDLTPEERLAEAGRFATAGSPAATTPADPPEPASAPRPKSRTGYPPQNHVRLTANIQRHLHERLKAVAHSRGMDVGKLIEEWVETLPKMKITVVME